MRSEWTTVGEHRLHYHAAGEEGPAVVLLHGGIIDASHVSWGAAIEPFAEDYRVFALDLLGYGESDRPNVAYDTEMHVDVLGAFLDAVGLDRPHLVGVSLGGGIALGYALRSPDRVRSLVLSSSYGLGEELPNGTLTYVLSRVPTLNRISFAILRRNRRLVRQSFGNIAREPEELPKEVVDDVYQLLQKPRAGQPYRRWRKQEIARDGFRTVYLDDLADLGVPTLLIHGVHDEVFPVEWSERAHERLPDSELERFEESAHWVPREAPERFNERTLRFLDAH